MEMPLDTSSLSVYFFAGDFADVLRRYDEGRPQIYQTHNEVAKLIRDLTATGLDLTFYSFLTNEKKIEHPAARFRFISLGAKGYSERSLLRSAVESDNSNAMIAHFPNTELLNSIVRTKARSLAVLATSYNKRGLRPFFQARSIVGLLNNDSFELVSNHCLPATEQLAAMGVDEDKLIAWDIPHPFSPEVTLPKSLRKGPNFTAAFAGSIVDGKGVSDIIRAVALLHEKGIRVACRFAGLGDIARMRELGNSLAISELLSFAGLIPNEEVYKMMVAADLVLVPSRTDYPEGFPLTMFEAIASRTPIVCSDHPMFRPIMTDGSNAVVFQGGNHHSLAAAIAKALQNSKLYSTLSENAKATWAALHGPADWRTLITKWTFEGRKSAWIQRHKLRPVDD